MGTKLKTPSKIIPTLFKDYATQREFTNHRRRKDFCKPAYQVQPTIREDPKKIRRIGILRKEIIRTQIKS
jgi:hypothetical protein